MAKACYKHGLFAIPYMMPLWFCARGEGGGGGCCDAPPWFSDFVPARKGGRGGLRCPLPSSLVLYMQEKEEEGGCDALALLLRGLW
jgi:hypothetical protein